jgi:hypothetical protein
MALTLFDGLFNVQRADHPIFGGADRQVHKTNPALGYF